MLSLGSGYFFLSFLSSCDSYMDIPTDMAEAHGHANDGVCSQGILLVSSLLPALLLDIVTVALHLLSHCHGYAPGHH
jgi:hypothetical protein